MSGTIEKMGFGGLPLYGTEKATFLLGDLLGRELVLSKFLWENLLETEEKNKGTPYGCMWRAFCERNVVDKYGLINKMISPLRSESQLFGRLYAGESNFLISEFLDTQRGLVINGLEVSYGKIFPVPATIAKTERRIDGETILTINPWAEGIPFDPTFLYQAGERFGRLVENPKCLTQSQ
jgi:hypothetical protein